MSYIPKFFFAATLIFIAFDLMLEWIVFMYWKLLFREYCIVLGSFVLIVGYGLQFGMLLSILLAGIAFVWSYSRTSKLNVQVITQQSNMLATTEDKIRQKQAHREIRTLTLHGFIFFGSAKNIVNDVLNNVNVHRSNNSEECNGSSSSSSSNNGRHFFEEEQKESGIDLLLQSSSLLINAAMPQTIKSSRIILQDRNKKGPICTLLESLQQETNTKSNTTNPNNNNNNNNNSSSNRIEAEENPTAPKFPTRVLILNFKRCHGMDATAVKSCFVVLNQLCTKHNVTVICCSASSEIQFLLNANELTCWQPGTFSNIEQALVFAENLVLKKSKYINRPSVVNRTEGKTISKIGVERSNSFVAVHDGMVAANLLRIAKCNHGKWKKEFGIFLLFFYLFNYECFPLPPQDFSQF